MDTLGKYDTYQRMDLCINDERGFDPLILSGILPVFFVNMKDKDLTKYI